MKTIAFFALLALAANAFNLTEYHLGVDSQYGFNTNQTEEGIICLNALSADVSQIVELLKTKNFDSIASGLGSDVEQFKTDFQTTCAPYWTATFSYIYTETDGAQNLTAIIHQNFHQYFAQVIQQIALWAGYIEQGNDFQAGETQSYINQILLGIEVPATIAVPVATNLAPYNVSEFLSEYFTTIFQTLGIDAPVNVSALVQCNYLFTNVSETAAYIKQQFPTLDFEQKLDAVQYLFSLGFNTIRGCEGAADVVGNILVPQYEAFKSDPVSFTLEVASRIALDLPEYIASIQQQVVDIQEGDYVAAGQEKVSRIENDFQGLVNYTSF